MKPTPDMQSEAELSPTPMLGRAGLIQRWQHGSDAFFWRHERAGRLHPVSQGGLLRYHLHDVLVFEGGLPPEDRIADYFSDLMHPDQVAAICNCKPSFILKAARNGTFPARWIGRAIRFVPSEVALWQRQSWSARVRKMNRLSKKTTPFSSDE